MNTSLLRLASLIALLIASLIASLVTSLIALLIALLVASLHSPQFFEVMERENKERQEKLEKERQLKAMYDIPSDSRDSSLFSSDSAWQNDVMGAGWSAVRLQRLGEWNAENCARFPNTYEVIRSLDIPLAVRGVCFARQTPGSGVFPHSDGRNFILTSHLGIKIPEGPGVSMKVGSETRQVRSCAHVSVRLFIHDFAAANTTFVTSAVVGGQGSYPGHVLCSLNQERQSRGPLRPHHRLLAP